MAEEDEKIKEDEKVELSDSTSEGEDVFQSDNSSEDYLTLKKAKEETRKEYEQIGKGFTKILREVKSYVDIEKNKIKDDATETKKELEDKIENHKLTIIETLGIFVALFTFISVDFQVFRAYRNPYAVAGLTMIFLGSIAFLMSALDFFILKARSIKKINNGDKKENSEGLLDNAKKSWKNNKSRICFIILEICLISAGIFLFSNSKIEYFEDSKEQIKEEILNSLKSEIENQNNDLKKSNKINGSIIENSNKDIIDMKKCIRNFGFTYKCFE
jgi:hypothetical protein